MTATVTIPRYENSCEKLYKINTALDQIYNCDKIVFTQQQLVMFISPTTPVLVMINMY